MSVNISVIVCTFNRSESLTGTLRSLGQLSVPAGTSWELIVVDNNSTDDTESVIRAFITSSGIPARYIFEPNQGLSHARNAGIRAARGSIIAFTDDDVAVDRQWLGELLIAFHQFGCMGIGGKIVPVWPEPKPAWLELSGPWSMRSGTVVSFDHGEAPCELDVPAVGANMAFKRIAFEKHGLFRTDLGKRGTDLMTGEDSEFCARLSGSGDKIVYAPRAIVFHPVPKVRMRKSYFLSYYFSFGRYLARQSGFPATAVLYFGVPRYLFKELFCHAGRWMLSFDSKRRFCHKLRVCESLGVISETHRLALDRE